MKIVVLVAAIALCALSMRAQEAAASPSNAASAEEVRELRQLVQELKAKVERLEKSEVPRPAPLNASNKENGPEVVPHEALVAEAKAGSQPQDGPPEKPKKPEPFGF